MQEALYKFIKMSQSTVLKDLKEKFRKKYWEYKNADDADWQKQLFLFELQSLNKRIEYLQEISTNNISNCYSSLKQEVISRRL